MNKPRALCLLALLLCAGAAFSQDYGLTIRSLPVFTDGDDPSVNSEYTASFVPWFALPLGEHWDLYLSGGISAEYSDEEWQAVPELHRFAITYRDDSGLRLEAGRISYREPLNLVMNGPFDGLSLSLSPGKTRLSGSFFYTGFLYKKTAYITMSPNDYVDYYDDDVYFASQRLLGVLDWEIPDFFNTQAKLNLGLIGQFDVNDELTKTHSQYALIKAALPFLDNFNAELGTILGRLDEDYRDTGFCFTISAGLAWLPPGGVNDRLSLSTAVSSGSWNDTVQPFLPINTIAQGKVLRPKLSGLALVETDYTARLHDSLSADLWMAYFFRTDSYTYKDFDLDTASLSPLLGGEVYGSLNWAPVSDLSFVLGGGVFFPQWGRVFEDDASLRWRVSLDTIFSF